MHGNRKHGHNTRANGQSPTYRSWANMIDRCANPKNKRFARYGERGVKVCERWLTFENFLTDMGIKPVGRTLERRDNDKGYSPDNCVWATSLEQAANQSHTRLLTAHGKTLPLNGWARELKLSKGTTIANRIKRHPDWPLERVLS